MLSKCSVVHGMHWKAVNYFDNKMKFLTQVMTLDDLNTVNWKMQPEKPNIIKMTATFNLYGTFKAFKDTSQSKPKRKEQT